jgi:plasmid maintenance system antidote protein VapI
MVFDGTPSSVYRLGMNKLSELMEAKGVSATELARRVGAQQPEIWRLANYPTAKNSRKMTPEWAERLAPELGVDPAELLFSGKKSKAANARRGSSPVSSVDSDLSGDTRGVILEADVRSGAGGGGVRSEERVVSDRPSPSLIFF